MLLVDHLVFLVPRIDQYVDQFEQVTGVRPVFGGVHAGRGTKNYLVKLDCDNANPCYLELLGLDPEQAGLNAGQTMFRVGRFGLETRPHLTTWAVHPADLRGAVSRAESQGLEVGQVEHWSRQTPDGSLLRWSVAINPEMPLGGLQPFLIDWGVTPHPSTNPKLQTIKLTGLRLEHPRPDVLINALAVLGVGDIPQVEQGIVPTIIATIDTPRGRFDLR